MAIIYWTTSQGLCHLPIVHVSTCDSSIYVHVSLSNWIIFIVLQDKEHSRPILLVRLRIINRKLKELAVSTRGKTLQIDHILICPPSLFKPTGYLVRSHSVWVVAEHRLHGERLGELKKSAFLSLGDEHEMFRRLRLPSTICHKLHKI